MINIEYDLTLPGDIYPAYLPKPGAGYVKMRVIGNRPGPKGWVWATITLWVPAHRTSTIWAQIPGWRDVKAKTV